MKHLSKGVSPAGFEDWKAKANEEWEPTYANLQKPEKGKLHDALIAEQGHVCCYCGRRITRLDSHIEHFRPQETNPDLALDYQNLHASCIRESKPGHPLHCGHGKGAEFDEQLHISPLNPDCERRFVYTLDGQILAMDEKDSAAVYMKDLLKLDVVFLQGRRAEILLGVFDEDFILSATHQELAKIRDDYRLRDANGRHIEFGHVVARFAESLLDTV